MVKSLNTQNLTADELKEIQESTAQASAKVLRHFLKEFNPDEMGFYGRKEGI